MIPGPCWVFLPDLWNFPAISTKYRNVCNRTPEWPEMEQIAYFCYTKSFSYYCNQCLKEYRGQWTSKCKLKLGIEKLNICKLLMYKKPCYFKTFRTKFFEYLLFLRKSKQLISKNIFMVLTISLKNSDHSEILKQNRSTAELRQFNQRNYRINQSIAKVNKFATPFKIPIQQLGT